MSAGFKFCTAFAIFTILSQCQTVSSDVHAPADITDLKELPQDENKRLAHNWILYLNTPECREKFHDARAMMKTRLIKMATYPKELSDQIFPDSTSTCNAVSLKIGMSPSLLLYPLERNKIDLPDGEDDSQRITDFVQAQEEVEVGWTSYYSASLSLFWINPENDDRIHNGKIEYGEQMTHWKKSLLGHTFEVLDEEANAVLGRFTLKHDSYFVIGHTKAQNFERDVTVQVEETFEGEWERSRKVTRTFTELGFSKGKLPQDLWGSMSAYYYNNRNSKIKEEWDKKGIFVNWWESDVFLISMPWDLKRYWQSRLQTLVEAWSGVELELTDIYGMRRYEQGARLLTHVDRQATHAASLIINVAQGSMKDPWALEIYDFADRLHEVTMEEGDIVYYESARCLHGRMKPLNGAFYVNLFAHYRPTGNPDWYTEENPEGNVEQLLDIGDCSVTSNGTYCTKDNEKVPFLSPSLEKLNGPEDLMRYWKHTSPHRGGNEEL